MARTIQRFIGVTLTIAAVALAGSVALASQVGAPSATLSVGDFLLLYAKSEHIALPSDATPQTAQTVLQAAGMLPAMDLALNSPLTHADVLRIGRAAGLKITSSTPEKTLDRFEAELFLDTFAKFSSPAGSTQDRVAADSSTGGAADHANTDKGKKKGRPFQSPSEPARVN